MAPLSVRSRTSVQPIDPPGSYGPGPDTVKSSVLSRCPRICWSVPFPELSNYLSWSARLCNVIREWSRSLQWVQTSGLLDVDVRHSCLGFGSITPLVLSY